MPAGFSVLVDGYNYFECPRWHDGRLWLSDFYSHQVIRVGLDGQAEKVADVPQQPSGLGWLPDGRLLIVSMRDRQLLRREADGRLVEHADLSGIAAGHLNDMVVDAQGRAYVGNFGFDLMGGGAPATAVLARVDAFDIAADGSLGPRRDWARFGDPPPLSDIAATMGALKALPDGATLDAEGAVWFSDSGRNCVVRVAPGGEVLQTISTGSMGNFACTLGGPDGRTLFICVAPDFHEDARRAAREAAVWTVRVQVPHAGRP